MGETAWPGRPVLGAIGQTRGLPGGCLRCPSMCRRHGETLRLHRATSRSTVDVRHTEQEGEGHRALSSSLSYRRESFLAGA